MMMVYPESIYNRGPAADVRQNYMADLIGSVIGQWTVQPVLYGDHPVGIPNQFIMVF